MARKVIFKVIKEIVLTKITERPDFIGFNNAYEQLRIIYWNNDSLPQKLNELGNILEQLSSALTFRDSHLKIYIDTIMPWLRGVSEQWIALESSLNELQDTSSTLSEVVILMDMTQTLLSAPALRCILDGAQLDGISQGICGVQQILGQLQLWQALPGDARIGDYLSILSGNPAMGDILGPSVQQLCQALAYALNTTLSPENTLSDQLVWLASLLNNPLMRQYVQPHLEVILGEQQATQLFSILSSSINCGAAQWTVH